MGCVTKGDQSLGQSYRVMDGSTRAIVYLVLILDKVVSLMGSLLGCPLAFVLPPLIQNRLESDRLSLRKARTNTAVAAMGMGAMVVSSISTILKWD